MEKEGLRVLKTKSFNILHTAESAMRQVRVAQTKLELMSSSALKAGMTTYLEELGERVKVAVASNGGKIPLSFDYIIQAEMVSETNLALGATIFSMLSNPFGIGNGSGGIGTGGEDQDIGASSPKDGASVMPGSSEPSAPVLNSSGAAP
jgi:hypothetical protein